MQSLRISAKAKIIAPTSIIESSEIGLNVLNKASNGLKDYKKGLNSIIRENSTVSQGFVSFVKCHGYVFSLVFPDSLVFTYGNDSLKLNKIETIGSSIVGDVQKISYSVGVTTTTPKVQGVDSVVYYLPIGITVE